MSATITAEQVLEKLKEVYDPEIPVNVVDLGLIYDVQVSDENEVHITMTLTAPGCGMGPYIGQQAEWAVAELEGLLPSGPLGCEDLAPLGQTAGIPSIWSVQINFNELKVDYRFSS